MKPKTKNMLMCAISVSLAFIVSFIVLYHVAKISEPVNREIDNTCRNYCLSHNLTYEGILIERAINCGLDCVYCICGNHTNETYEYIYETVADIIGEVNEK